jgi:hypothetical protein
MSDDSTRIKTHEKVVGLHYSEISTPAHCIDSAFTAKKPENRNFPGSVGKVGLEDGIHGPGYSEGVIILCTCISAMASRLWFEDKHSDRKRFTEILTMFSEPELDTTKISMPLLSQDDDFWKKQLSFTDKNLRLTGANDKSESELLNICISSQASSRKTLRQYSYANILYRDLRCGFSQTYVPSGNARADDPL